MRKSLKVFAGTLAVLAVVLGGGFWWLCTSLPQTDGTLALAGQDRPARIVRDANAVPHIFAETTHDAYFALGVAHAQDRLWQMDFLRRVGAGRLSEVLGANAVPTDRYIRTLGLPRVAEAIYERLSPAVRDVLTAYTDGVNAWLKARGGVLPPEFLLLRYEPVPWRPADPLLWSRLMAVRLGRNAGTERVRQQVAEALAANGLPAGMIHDLWPDPSPDDPVTVASNVDVPAPPVLQDSGSNGWIVHGGRTATGKPVLANDPHLRFGAPILWYLARIEAPGLSLTGATVPGVPFMVLGHNGRIAWGMTNGAGDAEDLFVETVDPHDPEQYLSPDGPLPFLTRREVIPVKGAAPIEFTVRETRHGPVISDLFERPIGGGRVVAFATPALRADDGTVEAIFAINRAKDWADFETAAARFHTPHTNLFFASAAGDIGLVSAGRIPIRKAGPGFAPVRGDDGAHDWTGFVPMADMPRLHNPEAGLIVNANNRVVGDDFPYRIARTWPPPYRARRILEILQAGQKHDLDASAALQRDTVSTAARRLLPLMLQAPGRSERAKDALALLANWNYEMRRNRPEPAIYTAWLNHLGDALIADEIDGQKAQAFQKLINRPGATFVALALSQSRTWCDNIRTAVVESCADVLSASLEAALDRLTEELGPDMDSWRWGSLHRAAFDHPVLSHVSVLAALADLSIASDGGDHTVNRGMTAGPANPVPAMHTDGSGYRAVYNLSDLDDSRFMIATGQSGNFLSPHYRDFLERWRDVEYITIPGGEREGASVLRLEPR